MTTGQADASESGSADATSAFHKFYENQTTVGDVTGHSTWVKASNLYTAANQTTPDVVNNWNDDSSTMYGDITSWAQDEYQLLVAQTMGNPTATYQSSVTADLQTYQTDYAQTKADISSL